MSDFDSYEISNIKDNSWFKNNAAHKLARTKKDKSGRWFCVGCLYRCNDPIPVRGTKSLLKTKDLLYKDHKYNKKPILKIDFE
jgi:hypothetical protein